MHCCTSLFPFSFCGDESRAHAVPPVRLARALWGQGCGRIRPGPFKLPLNLSTTAKQGGSPAGDMKLTAHAALLGQYLRACRKAAEALRDYLKLLYTHLMETLHQRFIGKLYNTTPSRFVLTTPAIWSHEAQSPPVQGPRILGFQRLLGIH